MQSYEREMYRCEYFPYVYSSKSCYGTGHHMPRSQYRGQGKKETNNLAAEDDNEERLQSRSENHGGEFDLEAEKIRRVGAAKSDERKPQTKNLHPFF